MLSKTPSTENQNFRIWCSISVSLYGVYGVSSESSFFFSIFFYFQCFSSQCSPSASGKSMPQPLPGWLFFFTFLCHLDEDQYILPPQIRFLKCQMNSCDVLWVLSLFYDCTLLEILSPLILLDHSFLFNLSSIAYHYNPNPYNKTAHS